MSYFRWRKEFGGLNVSQAKRLKELAHGMVMSSFPRRGLVGASTPLLKALTMMPWYGWLRAEHRLLRARVLAPICPAADL